MFDKLSAAEIKYEELSNKLCDPDIVNDNVVYRDTMREYKNLTPLVEKYREYKKAKETEEESKMLLEEGISDKDFRELVESELDEAREALETISEELKILLLCHFLKAVYIPHNNRCRILLAEVTVNFIVF